MTYSDCCDMFMRASITGTQCLLLDDGLGGVEEYAEDFRWHDRYTTSPTKRIVRVEVVAEKILRDLLRGHEEYAASEQLELVLSAFLDIFERTLAESAAANEVVGFKSVACYRTGLDVEPPSESAEAVLASLKDVAQDFKLTGKIRLAHKALNDLVVCKTLEIAAAQDKPIQFHTGLGDNDITLTKASPSHLQKVIKRYPETKFVLLHSSYPYTRDAGYLSAVYPNVYLDFGEVFPFVSGAGQRSIVQQMLEICPTSKILWSTDGHWWPESFYLGVVQSRQALYDVTTCFLALGALTLPSGFSGLYHA
ncbi:unnamed protein product [Mycena citricolor]|uniref:Amidohydrolase-related domain-containing protein n=1 Tax=Mycena citricolor TaxID=2018698 RepID=A0AAD2H3U9_9AGAR|nr:unnamed protein product [Mycena citricolor]CAK5273987.1 unnamed protein product [Mycena citricolor]